MRGRCWCRFLAILPQLLPAAEAGRVPIPQPHPACGKASDRLRRKTWERGFAGRLAMPGPPGRCCSSCLRGVGGPLLALRQASRRRSSWPSPTSAPSSTSPTPHSSPSRCWCPEHLRAHELDFGNRSREWFEDAWARMLDAVGSASGRSFERCCRRHRAPAAPVITRRRRRGAHRLPHASPGGARPGGGVRYDDDGGEQLQVGRRRCRSRAEGRGRRAAVGHGQRARAVLRADLRRASPAPAPPNSIEQMLVFCLTMLVVDLVPVLIFGAQPGR